MRNMFAHSIFMDPHLAKKNSEPAYLCQNPLQEQIWSRSAGVQVKLVLLCKFDPLYSELVSRD